MRRLYWCRETEPWRACITSVVAHLCKSCSCIVYRVFGETDQAELAEESRFAFSGSGVRMAGDNVGPCSKGASVVN